MTSKLSELDHKQIDSLLNKIFEAVSNNELTRTEAVAAIAHLMAAIAIENYTELRKWISNPDILENYKDNVRATRGQ